MTPLRRRMIKDLTLRNRAPGTIQAYTECVAEFAHYFNASPEDLGPEQVRSYLLHLVQERHVSWSSYTDQKRDLRVAWSALQSSIGLVKLAGAGLMSDPYQIVRGCENVAAAQRADETEAGPNRKLRASIRQTRSSVPVQLTDDYLDHPDCPSFLKPSYFARSSRHGHCPSTGRGGNHASETRSPMAVVNRAMGDAPRPRRAGADGFATTRSG
jgi:hypothetical protein